MCLEELPELGKDGVDEEAICSVGGTIYLSECLLSWAALETGVEKARCAPSWWRNGGAHCVMEDDVHQGQLIPIGATVIKTCVVHCAHFVDSFLDS